MTKLLEILKQAPVVGGRKFQLVASVRAAPPEGLMMEFGVWNGRSANLIAAMIAPRILWGFDSFEGLPEEWDLGPNVYETGHFSLDGTIPPLHPGVRPVKGWFEDTIPKFLQEHPGPAAFIHIDCDLASSARTVLDLLDPRIVPGTVIRFDEIVDWRGKQYTKWPEGEYRVLEEWLSKGRAIRPLSRTNHQQATVVVSR